MALSSALLSLSLTGCASTKTAAASDQNKSDCKFDFGADVSAYFSGETHLNNLVPFDGEKHFAETNLITFAPGARNADWHTHGEMYVIGVAGVGLYQEEGKEPIFINKGDVVHIPAGGKTGWLGHAKRRAFVQGRAVCRGRRAVRPCARGR